MSRPVIKTFDSRMRVVLDSVSPDGIRLPTVQWRHPRMIHSDFLTHRVFTRNGRSSRAVPSMTLLEEAKDPYVPHFMKNRPGMTAAEEFTAEEFLAVEGVWRFMAESCRFGAARLADNGVHKQWANRPLEWFGYIDVLMSTTDIANFFALREDEGAQPELRQIAFELRDELDRHEPKLLSPGEWHLPYIQEKDWEAAYHFLKKDRIIRSEPSVKEIVNLLKKISAARCARLTIKPFDGDGSFEAELKRYARLVESRPVHASPVEHQATPDTRSHYDVIRVVDGKEELVRSGLDWDNPDLHGNFTGWIQARKTIPYEAVKDR